MIYVNYAQNIQNAQKAIDFVPMSVYNDIYLHVLGKLIERLCAQN